tara:strand:+ start:82975 stop:83280 length:306 start_codon:yes stop_codon:yes gene_type:complete
MKLNQIPMGARFEYKGMVLTKTGPMTAATEKGGQHFIPKFAVLKPVAGEPSPLPAAESRTLDADKVLAAFETYHSMALRLADETARAELAAARVRFLAALN